MRLTLLLAVLASSGCLLPPQTLESPCLGQPATDGGTCPACASDADCAILTNLCHETAACVPKAGSWAVTQEGCSLEHPPTEAICLCFQQVCQAAPTR